ncbi:sulfotransferase domain-containing protein [Synechococcus sp. AH-551-A21]|nr:sulfotransferase domain-containing protein [Synechococcus sp. AH-551-A21]MDB4678055.1 sulfotransferase domain-containing protein [Synechococcus sp. AH-551-A21]
MTASQLPLVNAFCIGASKCGTTTLYDVLARHEDCCASIPKETNYFLSDDLVGQGIGGYFSTFYQHYNGESVCIDVSPLYSSVKINLVLDRISNYNPNAKIIYLVREPISMLKSLWKMVYRFNKLRGVRTPASIMALKGFEPWLDWCEVNNKSKINEVMYGTKINSILKYFPASSLYVGSLETLENDIELIVSFLGLSAIPKCNYVSIKSNKSLDSIGSLSFLVPLLRLKLGKSKLPIRLQNYLLMHFLPRKFEYNNPELSSKWRSKIYEKIVKDSSNCIYPMEKIVSSWRAPGL